MSQSKEKDFSSSSKNINSLYASESTRLLVVDSVLQKWSKLQKAIKENVILKDVIIKQQEIDFDKLKEHFIEYYNIKLQIRQTYEEIDVLKDNRKNYKKIFFKKCANDIFPNSLKPINDFLFILRNDYNYVIKIIELIESENENNNNNNDNNYYYKDSLIELFCHQFYDNILVPNPEQVELLILIYKLIEKDICDMNTPSIDNFLKENTFLGKFINYLIRKPELKIFLSKFLSPLILSIENENDELYMSFFSKKTNNFDNNFKFDENNFSFLYENIPKTTIKFKNFIELEEQKEKESQNNDLEIGETPQGSSNENNKENNELGNNYSNEYKEQISEDKINQKINDIKNNNNDLKEFYSILLEQIKNNPNIFNNKSLMTILEGEESNKEILLENIKKLKHNFLLIQNQIDHLLQSLIDKITAIPYIMRCICKIISILINFKFPSTPKYILNSFIGKFIFEKCIFPSLNFENNNIVGNRIYSSKTKDFLKTITNILSSATKSTLFNSEEEPIKAIFNYYLMEIIPILNDFYDKIIDVKFPSVLNSLIKSKIKKKEDDVKHKIKSYNYFKENSDEILHLQSICVSIDDILYILNIINDKEKLKLFEKFKDSELFYNSINSIEKDILEDMSKNDPDTNIFFVLFNEKNNSKIYNALHKKNNISKAKLNEEELKYKRVKLCIKNILKGLNNINSKSYTYLNMAISNDKFLTAIKYTVDDMGELINKSNQNNQIPLKWYGQYINNNKKGLHYTYKQNDFEKLFNEINKEESDKLDKLNELSAIIIARDGMNLRCCEKIIEKTKNDLLHIEQAKKYVKIEKFIDNEEIEVCILIKNNNIIKEIEAKKRKKKKGSFFGFGSKKVTKEENALLLDGDLPTILVTQDFSYCKHKNLEFIEKTKKNNVGCLLFNKKNVIPSHSHKIKDFIQKFSDIPWDEDVINHDERPKDIIIKDIINGERDDQIFKTFKNYMDIIRKKIKSPSNVNNNLFTNITKKEVDNVVEIIENFILTQMYKYIYPAESLEEDKKFYNQTKCLDWVLPKNLEIKKYYVDQLGMAELCIKKFDSSKSLFDKLSFIKDAFTNINNNIKYSEGKNEEAGQDEMVPIFQYILIRAQPKRMRTNINYINCFLSEEHMNGQFGYFVSQIESSFNFIMKIKHSDLNMSEEEFEENYQNAKKRHNIP